MKQKTGKLKLILILVAIAIAIKYIFVDFGIDAEFQITMSYRWATGDKFFLQMWEPYMTSTFICGAFIKLYLTLFHTTTGLVIFLQAVGTLINLGVSLILYHTVKKYTASENAAFAMAWIFFIVSPKDIPLADYSNMQMWFTMLLCLCLFIYEQTKKTGMIVLAGVWMCAVILSYPSCLIVAFAVLIYLLCRKRFGAAALFVGTCLVIGGVYMIPILRRLSVSELLEQIKNILALETSHAGFGGKILSYIKELSTVVLLFAVCFGLSFVFSKLVTKKLPDEQRKTRLLLLADIFFYGLIFLAAVYAEIRALKYTRYAYTLLFVALILIGTHFVKKLSPVQRNLYIICTLLSLMNFLSTILFSNLYLIASVPYLLIATVAAVMPVCAAIREVRTEWGKPRLATLLMVSIFVFLAAKNILVIRPMQYDVNTLWNVRGVVKSGPAVGIFSEYMGPYIQNETMKEWKEYVPQGSHIYLIGEPLDTLGYLYADTKISAPSLVPTPGYNETVLKYWEQNPQKYPDMIIASCWYGNLMMDSDSWILDWIEKEYKPSKVIDGKYWRYYYR